MQPKPIKKTSVKATKSAASRRQGAEPTPTLSNTERKALSKIEHIRAELSSLYRSAKSGQIPIANAGRLAYILSLLARIIADSDLEARITEIESKLGVSS